MGEESGRQDGRNLCHNKRGPQIVSSSGKSILEVVDGDSDEHERIEHLLACGHDMAEYTLNARTSHHINITTTMENKQDTRVR